MTTHPDETFAQVSAAPTRAGTGSPRARLELDVDQLFAGADASTGTVGPPLDEKLRQAYFWMVNHGIISPHYDVEFHDPDRPRTSFRLGDSKAEVDLPTDQSYSSFVLLPLLTFAVRGRCLLVGGPGRGKTASAVLMGVLAGYPVREVRRAMQHGHPQLTVQDMFGTPLPSDLVAAKSLADIDVAWRSWLGRRVKIVDEYNRIPTRTQSALLTVLADGYVEVFDQVYETGAAAWYLTANDDAGGGTFQVVDALRDRIDVVVKALSFNSRFVGELVDRAERRLRPEEHVPPAVVFDADEHDRLHREVVAVPVPQHVRRRLEYFASQLELAERGAVQLEYRTKDTVRLAGEDPHRILAQDTGRDLRADIGAQTLNGLSVRALQSLVLYAKAMAYFRGQPEVGLDDLRAVLPFVLHDKLQPDLASPSFEDPAREAMRIDRVSWLRDLFDTACVLYDAEGLDTDDPVGAVLTELHAGLDGLPEAEVRRRLAHIEGILAGWQDTTKLHGSLYEDALALKYAHQRYSGYLAWLRWERRVTAVLERASAFGRFVVDDRAFVDDALRAAAARCGDPELVRGAVLDVATVADALADGGTLDPQVGRALLTAVTALAARGRWRAGTAEHSAVLQVVPRAAALVRARPDVVVPLLVASARTVERSADPAVLAGLLAAAPPTEDVDDLRGTVLVATWRAGAVRFRAAALAAAAELPAALAAAALGLPPGTPPGDVLDAHAVDPWWWPGQEERPGVLRRVGGFRGFGGPWLAVPHVSSGAADGGLGCHVRADGECWAVLADVHGSAVVRLDSTDVPQRATAPHLPVPWDDEVTGWSAAGGDPRVVVVSRRHSYWVDVVRVAA